MSVVSARTRAQVAAPMIKQLMSSRRFAPLFWAQFCSALNDNVLKNALVIMRAIASMSFDESIAYTESQIGLLAMTEDAKEGLKAFAEKRKPSWTGK